MHGLPDYVRPEMTDYGDLREITASTLPLLGAVVSQDLSFSSPEAPGGSGGPEGAPAQGGGPTGPGGGEGPAGGGGPAGPGGGEGPAGGAGPAGPDGGEGPSGGAGPAGPDGGEGRSGDSAPGGEGRGGLGGDQAGGNLPFTGFPAAVAALAGTGLTAAGAALRKASHGGAKRGP